MKDSEYDKILSDPKRKSRFERAYYQFLMDELKTAYFNEDIESIRDLTDLIIEIIEEKKA